MSGTLDHIIGRGDAGPRLGATQLARLRQLVGGYPVVVCWDGMSPVPATAAAVVVLEAANAARIEMLIGSLHENAIVILPASESPAFDLLKSKLYAHGSIGAEGAEAPHHVWWGGVKPPVVRTGVYRREDTLFITATADADSAAARGLMTDLKQLGLEAIVAPLAADLDTAAQRCAKVDFIVEQWARAGRGVFWIDPDARVAAHPLLPQACGCDFAVHRQSNGAMTTGALYFNRTDAARALLEMWQRLTHGYPDLPESFLLDQAWILIASQRQIETAWLPDDYWQTDELKARAHSIIAAASASEPEPQLDRFAAPLQMGRRFSRHQAPEAHLIMTGPGTGRGPITVVIRDVLSTGARHIGRMVEAVTRAFATDNGGFSQLEIVLCAWDEDIDQVLQIRDYSWVLLMDPSEPVTDDIFRALPGAIGEQRPRALSPAGRESCGRSASPVGLVASRQAFIQRPSSAYAMTRH